MAEVVVYAEVTIMIVVLSIKCTEPFSSTAVWRSRDAVTFGKADFADRFPCCAGLKQFPPRC